MAIEREELADSVHIKSTKVRGADVLPFSAVFTFEDDPAGELLTAKFFGIAADDTKSGGAIEREILATLYDADLNKTDLVKAVKEALPDVGLNRIRDYIERLTDKGKIQNRAGSKPTERIYSRV